MKRLMTTHLMCSVALLWCLTAGVAHAEPAPTPQFAGGGAPVAPPSASLSELTSEVKVLQARIAELKQEASKDRTVAAYGSAAERYRAIGDLCSDQLELLEQAMDAVDTPLAEADLIETYDRVQRERTHVAKLVAILSLR